MKKLLKEKNKELFEKAKNLPKTPGVYLFYDEKKSVIYVGKAKNLFNRVSSYFNNSIQHGTKTYALVSRINDMIIIEAQSELEALILETELIKKYRPRYNVIYKDDKSYLYIAIRAEWLEIFGKRHKIQVVLTARKPDLKPKDVVFGPYPDGNTAKYIVKTIRKIFPFKDCSKTKFSRYQKLKRVCLFGDLNLCTGPCVKNSAKDISEYKKNIKNIKKLLSGESTKIIKDLQRQMNRMSKNQKFEEAAKYRDLIQKFEYISQSFRSPQEYLNNPYLVEDLIQESLRELTKIMPFLKNPPKRIECFDISNISGKDAVGSMVVALEGRIKKREYRRFKIKLKDTPDDFKMIEEVIFRRLRREKQITEKRDLQDKNNIKEKNVYKWDKPDLIVVDGGKGQVAAALKAMKKAKVEINVVGLAKKHETLVYEEGGRYIETNVSKTNKGLQLLIRLRDESHRFAQGYHHKLRMKNLKSI